MTYLPANLFFKLLWCSFSGGLMDAWMKKKSFGNVDDEW